MPSYSGAKAFDGKLLRNPTHDGPILTACTLHHDHPLNTSVVIKRAFETAILWIWRPGRFAFSVRWRSWWVQKMPESLSHALFNPAGRSVLWDPAEGEWPPGNKLRFE